MDRRNSTIISKLTLSHYLLILVSITVIAGCGKKGPPTLKSFEKPAAPSNLSAIHRDNEIHLLWNFPRDREITIRNFLILRSSGTEFIKIGEADNNQRSFSDIDFEHGISYTYKVLSQNQRGSLSNDSNIIPVKPEEIPAPPDAVKFKATDNSIQLQWQGQPKGVLYNVYKSYEKGIYVLQPLNKTPLTDTAFTDSFDFKRTVYYTVRSFTSTPLRNESRPSPELVVNPLEFTPSPPSGLRYFLSSERVYLSWNEPEESWVTGFRVYIRTGGGEYKLAAETQVPAYIDQESPEGKRDYRIHAVGPLKEGPGTELPGIIFYKNR